MPQVTISARAIRVTADLTVPRGHWLVVLDDDTVRVVSPEEARAVYGLTGSGSASARTAVPTPVITAVRKIRGASRRVLLPNGLSIVINAQHAKVLLGLAAAASGNTAVPLKRAQIARYVDDERAAKQVSARIGELVTLGLVERTRVDSDVVWSITNNGLAVVRAIQAEPEAQQLVIRGIAP